MLREIRAANIGIIKKADFELSDGLTVITGETGAGKTLFTKALLSGLGYVDLNQLIGHHGDETFVEVVIDSGSVDSLDKNESKLVVIRKETSRKGRIRTFLNGRMTSSNAVRELLESNIVIHSQNSNILLLRPSKQRELLDSFSEEILKTSKQYRKEWQEFRELNSRLKNLKKDIKNLKEKKDFLEYRIEEIENLNPEPGEDKKLKNLREYLKKKNLFIEYYEGARSLLKENQNSALDTLSVVADYLSGLSEFNDKYTELKQRLDNLIIELQEIAIELNRSFNVEEVEEMSLDQVEERYFEIERVKQKYGKDINGLIDYVRELKRKLNNFDLKKNELKEIDNRLNERVSQLKVTLKKLSKLRQENASILKEAINKMLPDLMLGYLKFDIKVTNNLHPEEINVKDLNNMPFGLDKVVFKIKNKGSDYLPIDNSISGGELSRLLLAIETAFGKSSETGVYMFDEVDSGIGGQAGVKLGEYLKKLSSYAQVICVTHLPQVAAFADCHFTVGRKDEKGKATAFIKNVDQNERINEIARMLSGNFAKKKALKHAEELLSKAGK